MRPSPGRRSSVSCADVSRARRRASGESPALACALGTSLGDPANPHASPPDRCLFNDRFAWSGSISDLLLDRALTGSPCGHGGREPCLTGGWLLGCSLGCAPRRPFSSRRRRIREQGCRRERALEQRTLPARLRYPQPHPARMTGKRRRTTRASPPPVRSRSHGTWALIVRGPKRTAMRTASALRPYPDWQRGLVYATTMTKWSSHTHIRSPPT